MVRADEMGRLVAFGQRLRDLREQAEMTQEDLAHAASMHRAEIGFIERAEREIGILTLWRLSEALDIGADDLVRGIP